MAEPNLGTFVSEVRLLQPLKYNNTQGWARILQNVLYMDFIHGWNYV